MFKRRKKENDIIRKAREYRAFLEDNRKPTVEHQIFRAGPVRVPEVGERFTVHREVVTWNADDSVTREILEWRLVD